MADARQVPAPQVLITGASAGIGRDLALLLAQQGANVALLARRPSEVENSMRMVFMVM